jgi:tripartite-type tricarboxylate transporter receptor subunit TctC
MALQAGSSVQSAQAADFYAGRTVDFVVGADVGGGFDIYARTISRHLGRFIPGQPTFVPRNSPGAGSAVAAASVYRTAPKDGTTIAALMPGAVMENLLNDRAPKLFEAPKFAYLASADSGTRVCFTLSNAKIKTYQDLLTQKAVIGAGAGGSTRDYAYLHRKATGAKYDVVSGYKGSAEEFIALERGEIEGICGLDWSSIKSQKPDLIRDGKLVVLVQDGLDPDPELTRMGVPSIWPFIKNADDRKAVELIYSQQMFSRYYVAPPGLPAERVKILRDGFAATLQDPDFLADAKKARIDITPQSGERVSEVVDAIYAASKDTIERAKKLLEP